MGLASLSIDPSFAKIWCTILQEDGLCVCCDSHEQSGIELNNESKDKLEVPYRIRNGNAELRILEVTYRELKERRVDLIFMPIQTNADRELLVRVQQLLIASQAE